MANFSKTQNLKDFAKELTSNSPLMNDREKGEFKRLIGSVVTIEDYDFITTEDEDYAVFIVKEDTMSFYFAGSILTQHLHEIEEKGYHDAVRQDGLPMLLTEKTSKNKRNYTNVEFYPSED